MNDKEQKPLAFPLNGLNVATSFGQQPKGTTPTGENVRAFDALANRGRGGSRPGLSKFISATVPSGANVIQHMNVIVDPQSPALLGGSPFVINDETQSDPDPRWGGRPIRVGGDGIQLNRNVNRTSPTNFVQMKKSTTIADAPDVLTAGVTVTLDSVPRTGNLIVVFTYTRASERGYGASGPVHVGPVQNGAGSTYTKVESLDLDASSEDTGDPPKGIWNSIAVFYKRVLTTSDRDVLVDPAGAGELGIVAFEYQGLTALDNSSTTTGGSTTAWAAGPTALANVAGETVLVAYSGVDYLGPGLVSLPASFVARVGFGTPALTNGGLLIIERSGVHATTISPTTTIDSASQYIAFTTAWKP